MFLDSPNSCTSRYAGEFCQHLNPCHSESSARCQNGGSCRVRPGNGGGSPTFECDCPLGFSASLCEIKEPAACDSAPCLNGATCRLTSLHTYKCDCPPGYTDHCASQPCHHGGRCVADNTTTAGYSCVCPPGYTGSRCTEDVIECSSGPGPCHHGRCFNTHGSYTCVCEPGYTGRDCDAEYVPCEPSPCLHGGRCTPLDQLRYECDCPTVFFDLNDALRLPRLESQAG
ncbi:unnamed protein product [Leptidea sinapis]|uniref:EGF-like domain-containing protein n=1 Tax=Leptidea sinapis TaxID=189913 RepID=A0A5E4QK12_9NEOP|nr:unnamed protein product [Leptidea sinapis]